MRVLGDELVVAYGILNHGVSNPVVRVEHTHYCVCLGGELVVAYGIQNHGDSSPWSGRSTRIIACAWGRTGDGLRDLKPRG